MKILIHLIAIVTELIVSGAFLWLILGLKTKLHNKPSFIFILIYLITFPFAWLSGIFSMTVITSFMSDPPFIGHALGDFLFVYVFLGGVCLIIMSLYGTRRLRNTSIEVN